MARTANDIADGEKKEYALVNKRLVKAWMWWSLVWITLFPIVGLLVSIKFHHPGFLDNEWLTFGRMRPLHVNGVIFGAFSTPFLGLLYYVIPGLCGRRMALEHWGWWQLWVWNLFILFGSFSFLLGYTLGFEAGEYEWPFNIARFLVLAALTGQVLVTIFRRHEGGLYVSLWYAMAALVWTCMTLILGNVVLPYVDMSGVNSASLHGTYIHYIVGLWVTPAGLALVYYFLPLAVKNPLFSHRLSLLGFWSIGLFYPFVGAHHYTFSPIPYHTQTISIITGMLLIIPVWTVTTNFFGTAVGRYRDILRGTDADSYAAKFLLWGAVYYIIGCFQGSVQALRRMQELTHFNDFVIGHSHMTVFGTFVVWIAGALYYVWPRITGRQLWSQRLAQWHLWLTILSALAMFIGLSIQGLIQGYMLEDRASFMDTLDKMVPWWVARTVTGAIIDIALLLMLVNFYMTARYGKPFTEPVMETTTRHAITATEARPAGQALKGWLSGPSAVVVIAGIGYFFFAVLIQGVLPSIIPDTHQPIVRNAVTGHEIRVADYTPKELQGREVYIREGCWYCHSQYVRPVHEEAWRWGPVSQSGEYAFDQPHLFSTRRIGPELLRVGRKVSDGWHIAHHWDPEFTVPGSIMPAFRGLFEKPNGDETPQLNEEGRALISYIQRLGTSIGDWREVFDSTRLTPEEAEYLHNLNIDEDRETWVERGSEVYDRRCSGCHGEEGDGQGPATPFFEIEPRDFTSGVYKFRSTIDDLNSLPTDEDLLNTLTHGMWGTAMPPWYKISLDERIAVIQYIKTFSPRWDEEQVSEPIEIPDETPVTEAGLEEGAHAFRDLCVVCHGEDGHGDGPGAASLTDFWGNPVTPANLTLPAGEFGGVKMGRHSKQLFKTIMTGVGGTPMPAFYASFTDEEAWNVVHHVQSLRVDAQMEELKEAGLEEEFWPEARAEIWAALSDSANDGAIETAVINADLPTRLAEHAAKEE